MLVRLRFLSIRCVELIVLWRDQFRNFALIQSKIRISRQKKAYKAIQTPYLCDPVNKHDNFCENYILKLKYDTKDFADLQIIKDNFNVQLQAKYADPFLISLSINGKLVAGADIRNLRSKKNSGQQSAIKRVIPLSSDDMQKAKACDEMIYFEKIDPLQETNWQPYMYRIPASTILKDFQ